MSALVRGVQVYRCIPPPTEAGITAQDIAEALGVTVRTAQRDLATFERAGMARREPGRGGRKPWGYGDRWWRA